jgi:hypothetical protein
MNTVNLGTGAGGANTNKSGKNFEQRTDVVPYLEKRNFCKHVMNKSKYGHYLMRTDDDKTTYFTQQNGFKIFVKTHYNVSVQRHPDEAFIVEYNNGTKKVFVLEKKNQNKDGSCDTKLYAGQGFKMEFQEDFGKDFAIEYGFCLCDFFKNKKYEKMMKIIGQQGVEVFFANDNDYFDKISQWLDLKVLD